MVVGQKIDQDGKKHAKKLPRKAIKHLSEMAEDTNGLVLMMYNPVSREVKASVIFASKDLKQYADDLGDAELKDLNLGGQFEVITHMVHTNHEGWVGLIWHLYGITHPLSG